MTRAAAQIATPLVTIKSKGRPKASPASREIRQLHVLLSDFTTLFNDSKASQSVDRAIKLIKSPVRKVVSLGLGSLVPPQSQGRRLKQLALFLAIARAVERATGSKPDLYAQDPSFNRTDEAFLSSFGIRVIRTSSGSDLGQAADVIDSETLIYSPFLTLDAYEALLLRPTNPVKYMIGDDFNALLAKWPKHSAEREQVEKIVQHGVAQYKRKAMSGEGFWTEDDKSFPMALYSNEEIKSKDRGILSRV